METLILLISSLFMTSPTLDAATMASLESSYTAESTTTYDAATGSAIVTNPDGSVIIINPEENN